MSERARTEGAPHSARRQSLAAALLLAPAVLFLLVCFVIPLGRFLALSFTQPPDPLAAYTLLFESEVYRRVMLNTIVLAFAVTALSILAGWPVAFVLSKAKGIWFAVVLACVLFPFWIPVLVRSFSWMLVLERNGPLNRLLVHSGLVSSPFDLLFNHSAVVIGMVHVLLPYMIIPLHGAMIRIDGRFLQASGGLGASSWQTFFRIYVPLCFPGLVGGAIMVFLLALGFFITPAMLGGANAMSLSMLIASFVNDRLAWSLAAAASLILLLVVLALLAGANRFIPAEKGLFAK